MHEPYHSLDALVRARLRRWPQRPPGSETSSRGSDAWMRGRPATTPELCNPFLKFPGTTRLRTLPDGLWLNFSGSPEDPFVDIFAIEACSSLQNLLDKRSRFTPSTQSLLAVCPVTWLLAPISQDDPTPRWQATGLLRAQPLHSLVLPVRDLKVMYGLKPRHFLVATGTLPYPHEYFVPMEALTAENGDKDPALQAMVARACTAGNFLIASS